jgi:hypothetical protein
MNNRTCKQAATLDAHLVTARRYLAMIAPGSAPEMMLMIVFGGLALWIA